MTHAQIAATARKPYADKIAAMVREREMLVDALRGCITDCPQDVSDKGFAVRRLIAINSEARAAIEGINYR